MKCLVIKPFCLFASMQLITVLFTVLLVFGNLIYAITPSAPLLIAQNVVTVLSCVQTLLFFSVFLLRLSHLVRVTCALDPNKNGLFQLAILRYSALSKLKEVLDVAK